MSGTGIGMAKKCCKHLRSSIAELQSRASEQLTDSIFVHNVWRVFPDITEELITPYGTKSSGKIKAETCSKLKKASYFAAKAVLEVCFDEVSRIRNIYKDDPTVLKDVEPKLEEVEKSYVKIKKFIDDRKNDEYLEGTTDVEGVFALSDEARDVEGMLKTYESLISSAIARKKEDRETAKAGAKHVPIFLGCISAFLLIVTFLIGHYTLSAGDKAKLKQETSLKTSKESECETATNEPPAQCKEKEAHGLETTGTSLDVRGAQGKESL